MRYPMRIKEALVYERLRYAALKKDVLEGKASLWGKRQALITLEAVNNLESLYRQYGDAVVDADGEVICRDATDDDIVEKLAIDEYNFYGDFN